jgi:4-amino-4-deoxy-L-arabinose transferase-like glycosyltransferase
VLSTKYWLPDSPAAQLLGDEPGYANTARELLNGLGYTWPGRVPLYPVFLAVLFWCTGESYRWIRILQCVLSVVTVVLTYALGKRLFGRRAGNIAALLVAISFPLVHQPTVIMSEVLFTPMLLLTGIVSVSAFRSPEVRKFALLGFCIGVCDLIRPTLLAYPLFIACALVVLLPNLQTALRCAASCVFAVALTLSPWMIHIPEVRSIRPARDE